MRVEEWCIGVSRCVLDELKRRSGCRMDVVVKVPSGEMKYARIVGPPEAVGFYIVTPFEVIVEISWRTPWSLVRLGIKAFYGVLFVCENLIYNRISCLLGISCVSFSVRNWRIFGERSY